MSVAMQSHACRSVTAVSYPSKAASCLQEIATEKAGIFKPGCPAFTIPQVLEAMTALQVPSILLTFSQVMLFRHDLLRVHL